MTIFDEFQTGELENLNGSAFIPLEGMLDAIKSDVQKYAPDWPKQAVSLEAEYQLENNLIHTTLELEPPHSRDGNNCILRWRQVRRPLKTPGLTSEESISPHGIETINAFLAMLDAFSGQVNFGCRSMWNLEFAHWTPRISLPLLQVSIPGTSFEQVSGIRLSPRRRSPREYAIVNMKNDESFSVSLGFIFRSGLTGHLLTDAATESRRIRDAIILRSD